MPLPSSIMNDSAALVQEPHIHNLTARSMTLVEIEFPFFAVGHSTCTTSCCLGSSLRWRQHAALLPKGFLSHFASLGPPRRRSTISSPDPWKRGVNTRKLRLQPRCSIRSMELSLGFQPRTLLLVTNASLLASCSPPSIFGVYHVSKMTITM